MAAGYSDAVVSFCEGLATFPRQGVSRDDIRPGLRVISYRRRVVIAYAELNDRVSIIGVFYGGRDFETALQEETAEE